MHYCPECGVSCHCGGDIDDIPFDDSEEELLCDHCPPGGNLNADDEEIQERKGIKT